MKKIGLILILILYASFSYGHGPANRRSPYSRYDKNIAPTVTDDHSKGFTEGSFWVDVTNNNHYICFDDTVGAAVWRCITTTGVADTMLYEDGDSMIYEAGTSMIYE
jgi:hypothetical protein